MAYKYYIHLNNGEVITFTRELSGEDHARIVNEIEKGIIENTLIKISNSINETKARMIPVSSVLYVEFEEK